MKNERKQLEIMENQLCKALKMVILQKRRYEILQSELCRYAWTCEEDGNDNEIANGILGAIGNIECALEHLYN